MKTIITLILATIGLLSKTTELSIACLILILLIMAYQPAKKQL